MQAASVMPLSPSFNTYSNPDLAGIAARVAAEFDQDLYYQMPETSAQADSGDYGGDFDFAFGTRESETSSPISADQIFENGKILPVYPVFNRDLLQGGFQNKNEIGNDVQSSGSGRPRVRHPLRDLFIEERGTTVLTMSSSSSSSEADEPPPSRSYCAWQTTTAAENGRDKKSISAGSHSKRWRFKVKDLVRRSQSEGSKDSIVLLTQNNSTRKKEDEAKTVKETPASGEKVSPAARTRYNRDGGEKRRSYLPYRQDILGFFGNVNGLAKNLKR